MAYLEWGTGYPGYRAPMDLPVSRAVVELVAQAAGRAPVVMPNMGGSLPLYLFADILQAPIVSVPVVNHDNNQHAANENLRIQNLWDAIETYAVLAGPTRARMDCRRATLATASRKVGALAREVDSPSWLRRDQGVRFTRGGNADFGNFATTV